MTREIFIQACLQFVKLPYKWGGDDPIKGFDCSGLVQELLAMVGIDPDGDQTAQGLYEYFKDRSKEGPRDTGSLVFFGKSLTQITHIGMIIEGQMMIEAGGGGSKTNSLEDASAQNAYVRIRPFNRRRDILGVLMPKALPWA
jgi:cell wall-associated NlpC family hydrolase